MTVLPVLRYPNPVLRQLSLPVPVPPDGEGFPEDITQIITDLLETAYAFPGTVGLAAPQIGYLHRIFMVDVTAKTDRSACKVLVNPVIVQASRNKLGREGCLSFPEYLATIKRATRITVQAYNQLGQWGEWTADGLEAIAIQHELDHLDGVLLLDRISAIKTDLIRRNTL
jgi:peptide deformylase